MIKKISLFIFSILLGFLFFNNVSAEVYEITCSYRANLSSITGTYKQTYRLDGNVLSLYQCSYVISGPGSHQDGDCSDFEIKNMPIDKKDLRCPESINADNTKKTFELTLGNLGTYKLIESTEKKEVEDSYSSCLSYRNEIDCRTSKDVACLWNETKYGNYCNVDDLLYVRCGDAKDIPYIVPGLISFAVNFLKILTPLILIIMSIISLLKAIASSNEDVIKKAQKGLIRKVIAAVMVFMVITIVQFVIMKVADSEIESINGQVETTNLSDCLNCLLNNDCKETVYYKTYDGSELTETFVTQIPR